MYKLALGSSNYNACMGTALLIQAFYLYGQYQTNFSLIWSTAGVVLFTWYEYISHRFILHFTHTGQLYHYLHGNHHLKPQGRSLHIPILYTTISNVFYFYLFAQLSYMAAFNAMTTYQFCYILFEHIHMEAHHPKWFLGNYTFRISHMYHHTHNKNKGYAFTTPTWDIIFNTFPDDALSYNWFAYIPIPIFSFYFGTTSKNRII